MREMVLGPIGMTKSTYDQPLPKSRMAEVATPYDSKGQPIAGGPHTYPERAPAGLWTTPSDLMRYAIEVQKALAGDFESSDFGKYGREDVNAGDEQLGVRSAGWWTGRSWLLDSWWRE